MVLTKPELLGALKHEVHILSHLISKIEPKMVDYRPTPKQRSTIELLRYLSHMGPMLLVSIKNGGFDAAAWQVAVEAASKKDLAQIAESIASMSQKYEELVGGYSDEDFRGEIEMFGSKSSRGSLIVNFVLGGHAAYRTQLFLYLKANGRDELTTMNLWAGMDAPTAAAS